VTTVLPITRVLIADPDTEVRRHYRLSLESMGCDVDDAANGRDALAKLFGAVISIVVADIRLAFITGFELCQLLRDDERTRDVPFILLTAEARTSETERARLAGVDVVLAKPCLPETLFLEIQRLCASISQQRNGHTFQRFDTTQPRLEPPVLQCPVCDRPLRYERSHIGGVSARHPEQWDDFVCGCGGTFQYRHRTRKLRPT
jgi:CheY-like chemotaxis protein